MPEHSFSSNEELAENRRLLEIGQQVVTTFFTNNQHRSHEITMGIDGERFHSQDMQRLVLLLSDNKATTELQIAALGHDIERIVVPGAGSGYKGERNGPDYIAYKKRHALKGADIIKQASIDQNFPAEQGERIHFLISHHDDPIEELTALNDPELDILVAADTLSWLNSSAPNYFNGIEQRGEKGLIPKMNFMFRKLPERYWEYIPRIKLKEPKLTQYLIPELTKIAKERNLTVPVFNDPA